MCSISNVCNEYTIYACIKVPFYIQLLRAFVWLDDSFPHNLLQVSSILSTYFGSDERDDNLEMLQLLSLTFHCCLRANSSNVPNMYRVFQNMSYFIYEMQSIVIVLFCFFLWHKRVYRNRA